MRLASSLDLGQLAVNILIGERPHSLHHLNGGNHLRKSNTAIGVEAEDDPFVQVNDCRVV